MVIDKTLLDNLTEQAKVNPRLRQAYDLRTTPKDQSQRILIRWHYKLWHEAMGKNAFVSLFWTGMNLVCGVYKKIHYVKNYSVAIHGKH